MTDEDPAYAAFGQYFHDHKTVNHSEGYSRPGGISNNLAESFNNRARRAAEGIYLNISTKYLQDYMAEQAWREDTCKVPTGGKLVHLLRVVLGVGLAGWWRGYTHGKHRKEELLIEGPRPAKGRGRPPGWKPKTPR